MWGWLQFYLWVCHAFKTSSSSNKKKKKNIIPAWSSGLSRLSNQVRELLEIFHNPISVHLRFESLNRTFSVFPRNRPHVNNKTWMLFHSSLCFLRMSSCHKVTITFSQDGRIRMHTRHCFEHLCMTLHDCSHHRSVQHAIFLQ